MKQVQEVISLCLNCSIGYLGNPFFPQTLVVLESKGSHIAGTCHTISIGTTWTGVWRPDAINLEVCCGWCSSGSCYSYTIY